LIVKETFFGILQILDRKGMAASGEPIVLIIKNIKSFPHNVLNDLIHLIKKYRGSSGVNLCLMLGV